MSKPTQLEDLTKAELTELIKSVHKCFEKSFIRHSETSACIYFFNTKNSVNCYVNISSYLIEDYGMDLLEILTEAQAGK